MCFSASVSFGVGIALAVAGVASVKKANEPREYAFAAIPLLFAVQQFAEGFVWLSLSNPMYARCLQASTYGFLIFAFAVWPVWMPVASLLFEKKPKYKMLRYLLLTVGAVVSVYLLNCLLFYEVDARIADHHILYRVNYPSSRTFVHGGFYFIATVVPPLLSRVKKMQWFGVSVALSYILSKLVFEQFLISVWCFFAAILSIMIYQIIVEQRKAARNVQHLAIL